MEYHDLKPVESTVIVDSKELTLRPFDLSAQVWAYNFFATKDNPDGMRVLAQRISDIRDAEAVLRLTWHLLKEKQFFLSYENFVDKIDKDSKGKWVRVVELYKAVVKTLGVSQPQIDEIQEELELKKSIAAGA